MRIALFSDTYIPDYINGVATSTKILRNELVKHGHDVIVVTGELPSDSDYQDDPEEQILRVAGLELQKLYGYRASSLYSFKGMRELKQRRIDIIHSQTEFGIGIFSRLAAEILDVPVVHTYHTMWADYSHYVNPMNFDTVDGVVKKVIYKVSKLYGDSCTELIVPSVKTKEALEGYGLEKRMHVIPTGLELDKFDPKNSNQQLMAELKAEYGIQEQFVITFLGRIAEEKSIDTIIEAVKILVHKNQNIRLLIVGDGPSVPQLKELVTKYQLSDYVVFTGPKESAIVPAHYHISDIFVSASMSETQGLTFIEAMASGIPVIARRDKNLEEVVKHNSNGFFFDQPEELAPLLENILTRDLTPLGKQAYLDAMKFSSEVFYEKVMDVYALAIKEKKYTYRVKSIYPIREGRNEVVFEFDEREISMEVSDSHIEQYKVIVNEIIERDVFNVLRDFERVSHAYNKALKYLTVRDYTRNQMRKKLMNSSDYDDIQLDATLDLLESKNLIDDERFALDYLKRSLRLKMGLNKAIYNLRTYDIESETIDRCLELLEVDEEYLSAIELINSIFTKSNSFSYQILVKRIRDKLYSKGYTSATIERAMSDYNFEYTDEIEKENLEKEFDKQFIKLKRRYSGQKLNEKMIDVLLRRGYSYEHIREIINDRGIQ